MFKNNKYTAIYFRLMKRPTITESSVYTELHHIIPKCLGGSDDNSNLVNLTAREHFIAHKLLCKMVVDPSDFHKVSYAFWRMCVPQSKYHKRKNMISRDYDIAKKQLSKAMKINNPMFRKEVVKKFKRKRPEQSKVAYERNKIYWSNDDNKIKLSKKNTEIKSKEWKITNILTNETYVTNRLKKFCIKKEINYNGLMSAMKASRAYKKEWVLESTHS